MRIGDDQKLERFDALGGFRHTGDGVAAVPEDHHRLDGVFLADLVLRQQRGVEPAGRRDARDAHVLRRLEAALEIGIVDFPNPAPVPPGAFGQAVIERQRADIEAEIGGALHVAVAAEDVGADADAADIAGGEQRDTEGADVGGADGVLGRAHAPDQGRRLLGREQLGDTLKLGARHAGDALDLFGRPLVDFLADIVHAVDALADEFLVLPAVLEHVPEDAPHHRDVGARADADVFGRMRGGARQARIDDDEIGLLHLLAFEEML